MGEKPPAAASAGFPAQPNMLIGVNPKRKEKKT